jgi:tetraacyldisaccharide 4'-kinase
VVLRGYGGDETLLHRELNPGVPVISAADRAAAARQAASFGCRSVILDDGFQHRRVARDLDLVLVGAEQWRSPPRLLPRGPFREGVESLRRADLVVLTLRFEGTDPSEAVAALRSHGTPPQVGCRFSVDQLDPLHRGSRASRPLHTLRGESVLAVSAVADPASFRNSLALQGARVELRAFLDHHAFTPQEAAMLVGAARGRPLVMTHKDAVKLRPLIPPETDAWIARQQLRIEWGDDVLTAALRAAFPRSEP